MQGYAAVCEDKVTAGIPKARFTGIRWPTLHQLQTAATANSGDCQICTMPCSSSTVRMAGRRTRGAQQRALLQHLHHLLPRLDLPLHGARQAYATARLQAAATCIGQMDARHNCITLSIQQPSHLCPSRVPQQARAPHLTDVHRWVRATTCAQQVVDLLLR